MSIVQHVTIYEHQFPSTNKGKGSPKSKVLFPTYATFFSLTILMKMLQYVLTFFFINYSLQKKVSNGPSKGPNPNQCLSQRR